MNKIDEILKKYLGRLPHKTKQNYYYDNTIEMMKEYAIYCCQLQKEICAKIAIEQAAFDFEISEHGQEDLEYEISRSPLPEELR